MNQSIVVMRKTFLSYSTKSSKHSKFSHNKLYSLWDEFCRRVANQRSFSVVLTLMFPWVLQILEFFPVKFDNLFLGQLENTLFHHYSPQIHVILSNLPLKVQNKCQIFSISLYHSRHVAQTLQKPSCSNSPPV